MAVRRARYLDWVSSCRRLVRGRSQGLVGYMHVADMEESGYEDFSRQFLLALRLYALLNLLGLFPICSLGLGAASLALGTFTPTRSAFPLISW